MTTPKKFLNDPSDSVTELISGLLYQYPNSIRKLANHNVILSSNIDYSIVNILSGGGSGHEPSHAGWIGKGMLTGAILGGIFASPSVSSILAAIRAVTKLNSSSEGGTGGCLLIVKNYTGDRLNFGMACELANAEGRKCAMVVVADDTALARTKGVTGARGVAGTIFTHKIAGAAALNGCNLEQVTQAAQNMANRVKSLGVALNTVTLPGANTVNDRLDANTIEIGLGIHGEAGIRQSTLKTADELAEIMVNTIIEFGRENDDDDIVPTFQQGDDIALMVNNLGGTSNFEMSILTNSVVKLLESEAMGNCTVSRIYVGSFMTSFDMQGASISIFSLTDAPETLVKYLDGKTDSPAWNAAEIYQHLSGKEGGGPRPSSVEYPEVVENVQPQAISDVASNIPVQIDNFSTKATYAIKAACTKLIESESMLTKYDTIVGDGDCGLTMERGAKEILLQLESSKVSTAHPITLFHNLADAVSASMGGTSGVLIELMFRKMSIFLLNSTSATGSGSIDVSKLMKAFEAGVDAVSFYGGASKGSRTMLDALLPAVEVMKAASSSLEEVAKVAVDGAEGTASMKSASAGRSNYLNEDALSGTPDPGAIAVGLVLSAIYNATKNL
mmetsp:Transcript_8913/g.10315  ORF Transcript_8913/g.10315 Transcript_8913/m.10315 type:complete len:616 (-) Transcript_8913:199-2046(-)